MKKIISMLLAATLLLGLPATCFAATGLDMPDVSIAVNNIKDETMEVAIQVGAGNFKSVGAVLEYDATKLQPIQWSTTAAITVPSASTAAIGWANAVVIDSVCPDNLSGKPALAYQAGDTGYLYLGAEAAAAQEFTTTTQAVTVRFGYLAAESENRFTEAAASVKLVQSNEVAFASPVKGSMIYQTENRHTGEYKFYYLNPLTLNDSGAVVPDTNIPAKDGTVIPDENKPAVTPEKDAETANKGEASTDDFVTLAFYDWDGTLLGTRIAAKGGSLIDPNAASAEDKARYAAMTDAELAAAGVAPIAPEGNTLTGGVTTNGQTISTVNKCGYEYAGWVKYEDYGTPSVSINEPTLSRIPEEKLVSLSNLSESAMLRASYHEKDIAVVENPDDDDPAFRRYEVAISPFKYDADGSYLQATVTVKRDKVSRKIHDNMVLVISLRPRGLGETQVRVNLENDDIATYTLLMPTNASTKYNASNAVSFVVNDGSGDIRSNTIKVRADAIINNN